MVRAEAGDDDELREIRLRENADGQWTARELHVQISAQGATRAEALENLDAVVAAVTADGGHEPTDEELRDLGVNPEAARTQDDELPDILD
jgi:predicted RNase H-like HicB family nuclease